MPKGVYIYVPDEQVAVIKECVVERRLGAARIKALGLPELVGLEQSVIRLVIRRENIFDRKRSEQIRRGIRLTPEKRRELAEYLAGPGREQSDAEAAREKGVSFRSVFWLRRSFFGPLAGRRRFSPAARAKCKRKQSITSAMKRQARYEAQCRRQLEMEKNGSKLALRTCDVCEQSRFLSEIFFAPSSMGDDGKVYFHKTCRICCSEIVFVKRHTGKTWEEAKAFVKAHLFMPPKSDAATLELRFARDSSLGCPRPQVRCWRCLKIWYQTKDYFYIFGRNGNQTLSGYCLACPGERRFFSLADFPQIGK